MLQTQQGQPRRVTITSYRLLGYLARGSRFYLKTPIGSEYVSRRRAINLVTEYTTADEIWEVEVCEFDRGEPNIVLLTAPYTAQD